MERYGLIGKTLKHSFSQGYFKDKFQQLDLDAEYLNFELSSIDLLPGLVEANPELCGLNVTIPYKQEVIPYLDEQRGEAHAVGAVNTIAFEKGKLIGYNTDVLGFRDSIKPFLTNGMERALIFGTGGASKAVAFVLQNLGLEVFFVSRTPQKQNELGYHQLNDHVVRAMKLIVNTTPLGTWPDIGQKPEFPYRALGDGHLLYDLVYNPAETAFMKAGLQRGASVLNGFNMLRLQAEYSWAIWQKSKIS